MVLESVRDRTAGPTMCDPLAERPPLCARVFRTACVCTFRCRSFLPAGTQDPLTVPGS